MRDPFQDVHRFVDRVRPFLPLPAHPRPQLRASLRKTLTDAQISSGCTVTNVFYAGDGYGLMCHLTIGAETIGAPTLVAPIAHLAFGRRHPIAREIAAYQESRPEFGAPISMSPAGNRSLRPAAPSPQRSRMNSFGGET
jgi:hypothetical protein